ncbi:GTPase IMAP family member 7-like [Engraulis encrasicolus]|uniref:GTPase IMAP family member 7-like n=1 Tax=Engraulis encrasicolus TaxID=184585 RepID=UPI002FCF21F5
MTPLDKQWVANAAECQEDDLTKDSCMVEEEDDNQSNIYEYEELPEQYTGFSAAGMEQWRIMLLGRRGVGKSSTGNTILRQEAFPVNMSLGRITEFCDRNTGTVDGRPVAVIDTPGLKNAKGGEKKVVREILKNISLYKPGPHVFLFTLPFGNLTQDDIRVLKIIERMFGKKVWWYTILVFTHGDSLAGTAPSDVISSADKELRDLIRKCSGGFVVFNNKDMANRAQVTSLMERIDTMLAVNGNKCYPIKFYPWSERQIRQRQEKHMEERAEDISQKERELETLYTSYELEVKKLELWRSTDEELRSLAEKMPTLKKDRFKSLHK